MAQQVFATKGNLIAYKKSLELARLGFDLLDRKRHILVREMMLMIDEAKSIQDQIATVYEQAYTSLKMANMTLGSEANNMVVVDTDDSIEIDFRSVMGVEIPIVTISQKIQPPQYLIGDSNSMLDRAYENFHEVKLLTARLAQIESSVYRLATAVSKTQKRSNALKNIVIPRNEQIVKFITESLEEKEREDFSRLKVIKSQKEKKNA
ncbi:MAG: V-type ATP synthase subunit D [Clostridia bacterium]|nr:V-type ATP synthase subunit D [Clostridia bacterium]